MRHKENLIKRRDKYLKLLKDRESKLNLENDELCEVAAMKKAEALSLIQVMENSEKLEGENKTLR